MFINDVKNALKVCMWADVVPQMEGHAGVGKTEIVYQIGHDWIDSYTKKVSIPVVVLYCATQEITDLIGFPIKVWKNSGNPVIDGVKEEGMISTGWAKPSWWPDDSVVDDAEDKAFMAKMKANGATDEECEVFWNRPKRILFLDEVRRSAREVMQALYPLILSKSLHTHHLPRGTRIMTADNPSGAYDVRMPDLAFMSRFCHITVETNVANWHEYAVNTGISERIRNFLTSNPTFLNNLPKDLDKETIKYDPVARSRNWTFVDRVVKLGHRGLTDLSPEYSSMVVKQVIQGLIGFAATEHFYAFADDCLSFEDILKDRVLVNDKKVPFKEYLASKKDDVARNKLLEKIMIEVPAIMKGRKFDEKEVDRLKVFLVDMESKEKATAVLQGIFLQKNSKQLDEKWTAALLKGTELREILAHLMKKVNK